MIDPYKVQTDQMAVEVVKGEDDNGFPCPHCEKKIRVNITVDQQKLSQALAALWINKQKESGV